MYPYPQSRRSVSKFELKPGCEYHEADRGQRPVADFEFCYFFSSFQCIISQHGSQFCRRLSQMLPTIFAEEREAREIEDIGYFLHRFVAVFEPEPDFIVNSLVYHYRRCLAAIQLILPLFLQIFLCCHNPTGWLWQQNYHRLTGQAPRIMGRLQLVFCQNSCTDLSHHRYGGTGMWEIRRVRALVCRSQSALWH